MDQSRVMQNADFLRQLGHGGRRNQAELIRRASSRQINAVCDVVRHILNHDIPALSYDLSHFQHQRLVLRSLISARISINRKKNYFIVSSRASSQTLKRLLFSKNTHFHFEI